MQNQLHLDWHFLVKQILETFGLCMIHSLQTMNFNFSMDNNINITLAIQIINYVYFTRIDSYIYIYLHKIKKNILNKATKSLLTFS